MNGTETIIEKIISDAREKAKSITDTAQYDKAMREKATAEWVEKYLSEQRAILNKDCADVIERRKTLAELDKRKLILKTKQDIIGEVIFGALKKLQSMPKKEYLKFVVALLEKHAEKGDAILLSADKVLTEKDLEKEKVVTEKDLTFAKGVGDFNGGVQLIGKACDKDLSFDAVLSEQKEKLTAKITSELFD